MHFLFGLDLYMIDIPAGQYQSTMISVNVTVPRPKLWDYRFLRIQSRKNGHFPERKTKCNERKGPPPRLQQLLTKKHLHRPTFASPKTIHFIQKVDATSRIHHCQVHPNFILTSAITCECQGTGIGARHIAGDWDTFSAILATRRKGPMAEI